MPPASGGTSTISAAERSPFPRIEEPADARRPIVPRPRRFHPVSCRSAVLPPLVSSTQLSGAGWQRRRYVGGRETGHVATPRLSATSPASIPLSLFRPKQQLGRVDRQPGPDDPDEGVHRLTRWRRLLSDVAPEALGGAPDAIDALQLRHLPPEGAWRRSTSSATPSGPSPGELLREANLPAVAH